jgi:hypothetical protein
MARRQTSDMSKEIAEKMVNPTSSPAAGYMFR